jgi:hypothetical protein
LEWKQPANVLEVHSFLGLAGNYQRFIEGVSNIARPMTALTQKGKEFKWTEACEKSFQELKTWLTTTPILMLLDIHRSFIIYCDASREEAFAMVVCVATTTNATP